MEIILIFMEFEFLDLGNISHAISKKILAYPIFFMLLLQLKTDFQLKIDEI